MTDVLTRALAAVTSRRRTEPPAAPFDCCPHIEMGDDFPEETRNGR